MHDSEIVRALLDFHIVVAEILIEFLATAKWHLHIVVTCT